jgi:hypothetical protein
VASLAGKLAQLGNGATVWRWLRCRGHGRWLGLVGLAGLPTCNGKNQCHGWHQDRTGQADGGNGCHGA